MRTLIEGYQSHPGEHCGSVAMRGLLQHYCGLELPESAVLGLGSGAALVFVSGPQMDPPKAVFGRPALLEVNVATALQVDYREQPQPDDDLAWREVREEVIAGRPTMLSGDILYLDYREYKVHFPGHRFVLLGFDDATEKAYIADRIRVEPELCSYGALRKSRNPPEGLSTLNLWGRFHGTEVGRSLEAAARLAIERCAAAMLAQNPNLLGSLGSSGAAVTTGIEGIRAFADDLPSWAVREDAAWLASFNARCIEKFGNGGGNFRRLYAGFLDWVRKLDPGLAPAETPALATRAADGWTALSETLAAAAREGADPALFGRAAEEARFVSDIEERLFRLLAGA
jgi:hypothetical protein